MIKVVSLSLLMSALKPVGAASATDAGSASFPAGSNSTTLSTKAGAESSHNLQPVQFCGEDVPLHQTAVTQRWVTVLLQQSAHRDYLLQLRKRAAAHFPVIEPILAKYRIPRDFKFLPLAESKLLGGTVSRRGAAGYWQLMPQTAREMGLVVRPGLDERNDLRKSTIAACQYLRDLYRVLGSWTLVAAAYNSGITHVQHIIHRQGNRSYYALRLHRETRWYLYRVLAYKELLTRPRLYKHLLKSDVLAGLITPLPGEHRRSVGVASFEPSTAGDGPEPEPTWGPRNRNILEETLAQVEDNLARAAAHDAEADASVMTSSPSQPQTAMYGLMGLRVLRFRRSRLYQVLLAAKRKVQPIFSWDWV